MTWVEQISEIYIAAFVAVVLLFFFFFLKMCLVKGLQNEPTDKLPHRGKAVVHVNVRICLYMFVPDFIKNVFHMIGVDSSWLMTDISVEERFGIFLATAEIPTQANCHTPDY